MTAGALPLWYRRIAVTVYVVVLLGTFSLGRAFSVVRLGGFLGVPLYPTEVLLAATLPLAVVGLLRLGKLRRSIAVPYVAFMVMGSIYMLWGTLVDRSMFTLRWVVLSFYALLVPVTWVLVQPQIRLRAALAWMCAGNAIGLTAGVCSLFWAHSVPSVWMRELLGNTRTFNLSISFEIGLAFLLATGMEVNLGRWRIGAWLLAGVDVAMVVYCGVRSAWVALAGLLLSFLVLYRREWRKMAEAYALVVAVAVPCVVGLDLLAARLGSAGSGYAERLAGTREFVVRTISRAAAGGGRPVPSPPPAPRPAAAPAAPREAMAAPARAATAQEVVAYQNIEWRLRVWRATWAATKDALLFGHGFSPVLRFGQGVSSRPIATFASDSGIVPPHNEVLTVLYRTGLVGLGLFVLLNAAVVQAGVRAWETSDRSPERACLAGALGGLVAWHLVAQLFDVIDSPPTNVLLWVLLGTVVALSGDHAWRHPGS